MAFHHKSSTCNGLRAYAGCLAQPASHCMPAHGSASPSLAPLRFEWRCLPDERLHRYRRMTRRDPLNGLIRQNRLLHDELSAGARRVIELGWFVLGSKCSEFE